MSIILNKTKTVDYVAIFNMLNKSIVEYDNGQGCSGQKLQTIGHVSAFDGLDLDRRLLLELGIQYLAAAASRDGIDWKKPFDLAGDGSFTKPAWYYFSVRAGTGFRPLGADGIPPEQAELIVIQTKIIDALKKTVPQKYTNHLSKPARAIKKGEYWNCGPNWKALNRALIEINAIPGDPSQEGAPVDGSAAADKADKKKSVGPSITFLQIIEAYHEIPEDDPAKTAAKRTALTTPPPPRRERKPQPTDTTEQRPKPRIPGQKPGDPRMKPEIWLKLDNIRKGCPNGYGGLADYEKILKSATQFAGVRFGAAAAATHLLHDAKWAQKFVDSIYGKRKPGRQVLLRLALGALRKLVIAASVGTITYTYSDQDIMGSASIGLGAGFGSVLPGTSIGAVWLINSVLDMVKLGDPDDDKLKCGITDFFLGAAIGGAAAASPEMVGKYFTDVGNLIGQIKKNANSGRAHYLFDSSVRETLKIPEEEYEVLVKLIEEADAKALKTLMEDLQSHNPGFSQFHALRELIDSGAFHVSDIDNILLAAVSKKKIIIELDIIEGKIKYVLNESYTEAIKIKTSTGDAKEIPDTVYGEILEFFNRHLEHNETIVKKFLGSREILVADAITQAKIARKLIDKASEMISAGRAPGRGALGNKQLEISDLSKTFDEVADEVMSQPHGQRVGKAIGEYHAAMERLKAAARKKGHGPGAGGDEYTVLSDQFAAAKKKDVAEATAAGTGVATTHRNKVLATNRFGDQALGDVRELFTAFDEVAETSIELQKALVTVELLYKSRIGSLHTHLKLIDQIPTRAPEMIIKKRKAKAGLVEVLKESNYVSYEAAAFARLSKKLGPRFDENREAEKALTRWWRKMSADTNIVSSFISTSSKLIPALAFYGISKAPEYIYSKLDANSAEGFSDDFIKAYNDLNEGGRTRLIEISWNGIIDQLLIAMNHTRRERTVVPGKEGSIKRIGQVVSDVHQARNIKALLNVLVQEKFHQKGIRNLVAAAVDQEFPGIVELGVEDPWPWRLGMNMMHDIYADPASKLYGTQGLDIGELSKIWKYTGDSATDDTSDSIVFFQCTSNDLAKTRCADKPGPFTILYRTLFNNRKKIKLAAALSVSQKARKRGPQQEGRINKGAKTMQKNEIYNLIKEAFSDNMYGQYPYSHNTGEEDQPSEDYQQEWDKFSLEILEDRSREGAIEFAKILIKEFELLTFVLDAVGKDQSLGSEILRKMEEVDIKRIKSA